MSDQRWRRANELFEQALDLPEEQRSAWLDGVCADRPALRQEVERRLVTDAKAEASGFLAEPIVPILEPNPEPETASSSSSAKPPPDQLGPYRILDEIGRGGMGIVYAAERSDDAFHRKVAIKVISAGAENDEVARRLRSERRILALLEHANIARIYDAGTAADGRPYFVMEHIIGVPIDRYCTDQDLSVRQRIELMHQVCEAVDYAHRNLVIHRDLKPSNISVTEEGKAILLDFGLAKVLETDGRYDPNDEPTVPWRQHLTLHYASPEQIRGQRVSTASDVYALGVLLFRLLTGVMPRRFEGLSPWEAEQQMTRSEVPRPSATIRQGDPETDRPAGDWNRVARQLEGDLDAIVLKSLRTDPDSRYRSAAQLAEDLHRYLQGLPVGARRGSMRYRLGKMLRRHRLATALATAALSLLIAFATSTVLSARRLARSQTQLLEEQAKMQKVQSFLLSIFEQAGPYVSEGVPITVRQAVDSRAARLNESLDDQPAVKAAALSTLGWVYLDLGVLDQALDYHSRALEIRRELELSSAEIAESLDGVAAALREQWQFERADQLSASALDLHRQATNDPRPLLRSLNHRVKLFCLRKSWQTAEPLATEALALARSRIEADDPEIAKAFVQHAQVLKNIGQAQRARSLYLETELLFAERYESRHPIFAPLYNNLGIIEAEAGRVASAADYWQRADAQYRTAFGDVFYDRVIPLTHLGRLQHRQGDFEQAEQTLRTALDVALRSPALGPQNEIGYFGRVAVALGELLASTDRCPAAQELLADKVEGWRSRRPNNPIVLEAQTLLQSCEQSKQKDLLDTQ